MVVLEHLKVPILRYTPDFDTNNIGWPMELCQSPTREPGWGTLHKGAFDSVMSPWMVLGVAWAASHIWHK